MGIGRQCIASLLLVIMILAPICCTAQSNHALRWGVNVDDEFEYVLERKQIDASMEPYLDEYAPFITRVDQGQSIIARVVGLESIPDHIDNATQMPQSNCTLIRANDSTVIMEDMPIIVIPVGDWNFTTEIMNFTDSEDMTFIDTETEWGRVVSSEFYMGVFKISFYWEMRYLKANGTLTVFTMSVQVSGTTWIDVLIIQTGQQSHDNRFRSIMISFALQSIALVIVIFGTTVIYQRMVRSRLRKIE